MKEFRDDAVVLRTYKSGESDRVVVLWTEHHGKVRVLAKGIRKSSSRLGGNLETLAYVNVDLVKTRGEFYIARHVAHRERLTTLRSSYARINAGYAVVEVVDAVPSDDVADEGIFDLLTRVLLTLDDESFNPALVPASFYFKLLTLDGSGPVVEVCVNCERSVALVAFDAAVGGTLCADCRSGVSLSRDGLELIRRIVGGDLAAVLREESPAGAGEVMAIALDSIEAHFGKRLRASRSTAPLAPLSPLQRS
ncbi:MAG TPA: DNA repair protein RecO [Acidimicrobiales bacterium]